MEQSHQVCYTPIGIVKSPYNNVIGTPIQSHLGLGSALIEIYPQFSEGLTDLEGFSHIFIISHLHQAKESSLLVMPFLDETRHGVFATRSPSRPNPIGISVVKLLKIENCTLHISHTDLINNTPVLDIKPYTTGFDVFSTTKEGWFDKTTKPFFGTYDDGRFT